MIKLFSLVFNFSFSSNGKPNVNKAMAFLLTFLVGGFCYLCSAHTNSKGIESLLIEFPELIQWLGQIFAYLIDPIIWCVFVMIYLQCLTIQTVSKDEDINQLLNDYEYMGRNFIFTSYVLLVGLLVFGGACSYATYKLSQFGAKKASVTFIKENHKPASISSVLAPIEKSYSDRVGDIKNTYLADKRALDELKKEKEPLARKKKVLASKGQWVEFSKAKKAEAWLSSYESKVKSLQVIRDKAIAKETASSDKYKDVAQSQHSSDFEEYEEIKANSLIFSENAVNIWFASGLFVLLLACLLTTDDFNKEVLVRIKAHVTEWEELLNTDVSAEPAKTKGKTSKGSRKSPTPTNKRKEFSLDKWMEVAPDVTIRLEEEIKNETFTKIRDFIERHSEKNFDCLNVADVSYIYKRIKEG